MSVNIMRIDDRLIHGQIVTAWLREAGGEGILVADDLAASDATQKMLLKFATPKGTALYIETIKDAAEKLIKKDFKETLLLLVRNPENANRLFELGFEIDTVNLGNISNTKSEAGRKALLPYIHVEQKDVDNLKLLSDKGININVRAVPTDKPINVQELLKKY